jgi:hypothetical protein
LIWPGFTYNVCARRKWLGKGCAKHEDAGGVGHYRPQSPHPKCAMNAAEGQLTLLQKTSMRARQKSKRQPDAMRELPRTRPKPFAKPQCGAWPGFPYWRVLHDRFAFTFSGVLGSCHNFSHVFLVFK